MVARRVSALAASVLEYVMETLTQQRANELLAYCKESGSLTRKVSLSRSVKVGDAAGFSHPTKKYISLYIDGKRYKAHRVVWLMHHGEWPKQQLDHINGDKTDNRLENLRDVSCSVNAQNKRTVSIKNTSGLLGVSWMKAANKYRAQLQVSGKPLYLGLFESKEAAHDAYLKAKRELHEGCTI
jgi:HNH endonuclease